MPRVTSNLEEIGVQLGGLIEDYARRKRQDIDEEVREQAGLLRNDIVQGWPVDTGASRAGFQGPIKVGYAQFEIRNFFPYAKVIEFGGYPGVGPKTAEQSAQLLPGGIQINGGIYPTQRPSAPVRRALSRRTLAVRQALSRVLART